jgi:hypothetical protein
MLKRCCCCKKEKDVSEFGYRKSKNCLRENCKICHCNKVKDAYKKNPIPTKERTKRHSPIQRKKRKDWLNEVKAAYGCQLCGLNEKAVLDFHHIKTKEFDVTSGKNRAMQDLKKEINKCVVLCANCHRRAHAGTHQVNDSMLCHLPIDSTYKILESESLS